MISSKDLLKRFNECPVCDWDLIVISSRDESQRRAFEQQLNQMKQNERHLITEEFKFLVLSDQLFMDQTNVGLKLGSGGSTIHIFKYLVQEFGDNFFKENKVLLIHSGGYSQRLPHYSILGKLFSNLPIDMKINQKYWTTLDVKLALFSPLPSLMPSGVWVTAADDIVIYSYDESDFNSLPQFRTDEIVCLGHPSSIDISMTHGVYVLQNQDLDSMDKSSVSLNNCLKVLQKPTLDELKKFNAFVRKDENEFCITDSSYYLGADIVINKFLNFPIESLDSEIDCYGHFLCPLGSDPITKYPNNKFVSPLNDILFGTEFKVLFINKSKFFHLGTINEYLFEMTDYKNKELAKSLSFKTIESRDSIKGTVICSTIDPNSVIDSKSVVEFCDFSEIVIETDNNLLYNCFYGKSSQKLLSIIRFPANYLIYSVPVISEGVEGWCTFGCQLNSQLKSNLWSDKVFPVCETSNESLISTLNLINNNMNETLYSDCIKLSMSDVKDVKNIDLIINFQNKLKFFN